MTPGKHNGDTASDVAACRRFRVTGRVQGVFFRDSTRQVARRLALTGYASNEADGSVEVLACGSQQALDELAEWLSHGPPMASVDNVSAVPTDEEPPPTFTIR